jgi:heat shock protein HtpX
MNYLKTTILLAVLTAIFIFLGDALGGRQGAMTALVLAGVMNIGAYWFSDKIVLAMYRATEVTEKEAPELYGIVRDLTMKSGMPMPKVYIIPGGTPNAFATGRNPSHAAVAATEGIMSLLTKEELRGVMAHEMSHVANRDILISTVAATIAGAISYLSHMAYFASMFGGRDDRDRGSNPAVLLAMMIIAPLAATIVQLAISRSREFAADRGGAMMVGDPMPLANALAKLEHYNRRAPMPQANEATAHMFIVNPLSAKGMFKLFSTHPPVEERIRRLKEMTGAVSPS